MACYHRYPLFGIFPENRGERAPRGKSSSCGVMLGASAFQLQTLQVTWSSPQYASQFLHLW